MNTETLPAVRWHRGHGGNYADVPDLGRVRVERIMGKWRAYLDGGYVIKVWWRTLVGAKAECIAEAAELRAAWGERQADTARRAAELETVNRESSRARIASKIQRCRLVDARILDPAWGVDWSKWAENRVGCTAADVRQAVSEGRALELLDELTDIGDLDKLITLWYRDRFGSDHTYRVESTPPEKETKP